MYDISLLRAAMSEGAMSISLPPPECFALDTFISKRKDLDKYTNVSLKHNAQDSSVNRFAFLIQRHIFSLRHKIIILTAQQ